MEDCLLLLAKRKPRCSQAYFSLDAVQTWLEPCGSAAKQRQESKASWHNLRLFQMKLLHIEYVQYFLRRNIFLKQQSSFPSSPATLYLTPLDPLRPNYQSFPHRSRKLDTHDTSMWICFNSYIVHLALFVSGHLQNKLTLKNSKNINNYKLWR